MKKTHDDGHRRATSRLTNVVQAVRASISSINHYVPSVQQLWHAGPLFSKTERRVVAACLILATISSIWVAVNQGQTRISVGPKTGGVYREALIGQPTYLNPLLAPASAVDADLTRLLFSGLFRHNAALEPIPDIAEDVMVSEDGKVYTVTIRPTARWHDGEPVTVEDVLFTFERATDPKLRSPLAQTFSGIIIERMDDQTVRFTLPERYPAFLEVLTVGLLPKHIWAAIAPERMRASDFNLRPIGNGLWQYASLAKESDGGIHSFTLVINDDENRVGYLDQLLFKFYPDESSALSALRARSVDGIAMLANSDANNTSLTGSGFNRYDMHLPAITAIFFNLHQTGPTSDQRVRQALNLAVDRRALVLTAIAGEATVSRGPFPDTEVGAAKQAADTGAIDRTQAEELLDRAGWKKKDGRRTDRRGTALTVTLTAVDREPDRSVAQFVQQSWRAIGVNVKINIIAPATAEHVRDTVIRPRAYDALLYTMAYGAMIDPYPYWHSSQRNDPGLNLTLLNSADADILIERIRRSPDANIRDESFAALRKIITDETAAVFLFSPVRQYIINHDIRGVVIGKLATPADRFNTLEAWYTKIQRRINW